MSSRTKCLGQSGGDDDMSLYDADGQPLNPYFNRQARADRDITEMLGLAKGILADGIVQPSEVEAIRLWLNAHPSAARDWPVSAVWDRLERIFADGRVDADEREDLGELLRQVVGGDAGVLSQHGATTELPFDRPAPTIIWQGRVFVFTGKMACGTRKHCQDAAVGRGGVSDGTVTRRTNYLVLGAFGSRDWKHTSFGRKIEDAVALRDAGQSLAIISEQHWVRSVA